MALRLRPAKRLRYLKISPEHQALDYYLIHSVDFEIEFIDAYTFINHLTSVGSSQLTDIDVNKISDYNTLFSFENQIN